MKNDISLLTAIIIPTVPGRPSVIQNMLYGRSLNKTLICIDGAYKSECFMFYSHKTLCLKFLLKRKFCPATSTNIETVIVSGEPVSVTTVA